MERGEETKKLSIHYYPNIPIKWIVDGGALQSSPTLITTNMIITPNIREIEMIETKLSSTIYSLSCTILTKDPPTPYLREIKITITGGSWNDKGRTAMSCWPRGWSLCQV
jgi:hypothetical protein